MAKALDVAGLSVVRSASRDGFNNNHSDGFYRPNPDSLYEIEPALMRKPGFPLEYEGKVLKVVVPFLHRLAINPSGYRVVFMRRDPREIVESYMAAFGSDNYGLVEAVVIERVDYSLQYLRNRRDVNDVSEFWYRDILSAPLAAFQSLASDGWPIDPQVAATVVQPELCRFRREALPEGI